MSNHPHHKIRSGSCRHDLAEYQPRQGHHLVQRRSVPRLQARRRDLEGDRALGEDDA